MDATSFHQWAISQLAEIANTDDSPTPVSEAAIARLHRGQTTWLATLESVADGWMRHDAQKDPAYRGSADYLRRLLPLLIGDATAIAHITQRLATINARKGQVSEAFSLARQAHLSLLHQEYAATTLRIQNELLAASLAVSVGDTASAETHYLNVMSYNWANVEEYATLETLRDCYGQAARGLIHLRRGKLSALQNIFFFPAMADELQPLLDEAIQKAKSSGR